MWAVQPDAGPIGQGGRRENRLLVAERPDRSAGGTEQEHRIDSRMAGVKQAAEQPSAKLRPPQRGSRVSAGLHRRGMEDRRGPVVLEGAPGQGVGIG
jgi:hypothetical protein